MDRDTYVHKQYQIWGNIHRTNTTGWQDSSLSTWFESDEFSLSSAKIQSGRQGKCFSVNMHSCCWLVDCNKLQFFHKAFVTLLIMPLSAVRANNGEQWFRERKPFCAKEEKINTWLGTCQQHFERGQDGKHVNYSINEPEQGRNHWPLTCGGLYLGQCSALEGRY